MILLDALERRTAEQIVTGMVALTAGGVSEQLKKSTSSGGSQPGSFRLRT